MGLAGQQKHKWKHTSDLKRTTYEIKIIKCFYPKSGYRCSFLPGQEQVFFVQNALLSSWSVHLVSGESWYWGWYIRANITRLGFSLQLCPPWVVGRQCQWPLRSITMSRILVRHTTSSWKVSYHKRLEELSAATFLNQLCNLIGWKTLPQTTLPIVSNNALFRTMWHITY